MKDERWRQPKKWSLCAIFLFVFSVPLMANAQEGDIAEAEHLNSQVSQDYAAGRYQQAIPLAQRALDIAEKAASAEQPTITVLSLINLARLYRATGAYAKAEPLYQHALVITEKALGPDHPVTATVLNNLAGLYYATGAYAKAEPLYQRALAIQEKTLGSEDIYTATSLDNLAGLYKATGAYAKAEPLHQRSLAIREKVLGPEHPDTAISLNSLAGLYCATGAYAKAEPLYQRALAITEKALGPGHPDTATALNNLAFLYKATGAYAKAEPLYQRALAINEKAFGPDNPSVAATLNNLASLYQATGAYAKTEPLLQRALAIKEKALGPDHPDTAVSLNNLASLYQATGAYAKAEPLYQRALAINEKALGPDHPTTSTLFDNLAGLYDATGAYVKVEPLYQRALVIREKALGPDHPDTATSLNNLAALYYATGAHAKAEPLYQRALAITEKALGPDHPDTATSLNNLAGLYNATDAYAKAEPLYQRALDIRERALGSDHPDTANSLDNLAGLYLATGAYVKAEPLYQRALAIHEKTLGLEHPDTAISLNNLAALYQTTGVYEKAMPLYQRAQDIGETNTTRFLFSGDEARKRAYLEQRRIDVDANTSFSLAAADPRAKALGLTAVLRYKGRVLDAVADNIALLRRNAGPKDQKLFDELAVVAQQFSTLAYGGLGDLSPEAYRDRWDTLTREQERLEGELSARSAAFRQAVAPVTLEGVRQRLPADMALVEWFRYQPLGPKVEDRGAPRYVAYVLRREGEPVAIDLGAAQDIEALTREFGAALSDRRLTTPYDKAARQLYGKLIEPLQSSLSGIHRLLLSPDGALNTIPFAALIDGNGAYLTQRFELTYLTSGRDLLAMASPEPARGGPVVMANPDYGQSASLRQSTSLPSINSDAFPRSPDLDRSGLDFKPLTGTAEEAEALRRLLKLDVRNALTGAHATEGKLKGLHGPRILHIATHGFFLKDQEAATGALRPVNSNSGAPPLPLGENPLLRSGLALAGANARRSGASDDGILTAAEAAQLDLRGTQLVALSACETGLGDVRQGEGVYGLRRALVLAGAQTQLVSLWKVDDAQTRALMVNYYKRLLKGEGRSAALREVQKAMISDPATQHPYYWAAFLAIGNWAPLTGKK